MNPFPSLGLFGLFLTALPAQQLIGVSFTGSVYAVEAATGAGTLIGQTGLSGHNAMTRSRPSLGPSSIYVSERTGTASHNYQFHLDRIDENTGVATRIMTNTRDFRALAPWPASNANTILLGVAQGVPDEFCLIDLTAGSFATTSTAGFANIQALAAGGLTAALYAWDTTVGLLRVSGGISPPVATDVNPAVGTNGVDIQFLTFLPDGRLVGGRDALYVIDVVTGVPTLIGGGGYVDLRGCDLRASATPFGQGCAGTTGTVELRVTGAPQIGQTLTTISDHHGLPQLGVHIIGFSNQVYVGNALPFDLSQMLGTVGCRVYASLDVTTFGFSSGNGNLTFQIALPAAASGLVFHVQHVCFETVPGGMSWSNGVTVRVLS